VIHRDCPPSVEAYLQESGRAGRDGGQARAVLLWGPEDNVQLARTKTAEDRARLEQLFSYARNFSQCRREALLFLLNYEGERVKPEEYCCDVCSGEGRSELREEPSLAEFFRRNRRSYTVVEAAWALADFRKWSAKEMEETIRALIEKGTLAECKSLFWKNKVVPVSKP